MKVIIAGSRTFDNYSLLKEKMDNILKYTPVDEIEIVSGACDSKKGKLTFTRPDGTKVYGADGLGEKYAQEKNILVKPFPADWSYGKKAGYIRNRQMAEYATNCVCFWDGKSKGSKMMIDLAQENGLKLRIIKYSDPQYTYISKI